MIRDRADENCDYSCNQNGDLCAVVVEGDVMELVVVHADGGGDDGGDGKDCHQGNADQ